jgi:hypothetical protein
MGENKMKWYSGIADFGGIESFKEVGKAGVCHPALAMRADANRHRFAMLYWVQLSDFKAKVINDILNGDAEDRHIIACDMLHNSDFVEDVMVERDMLKKWCMIPNKELFP